MKNDKKNAFGLKCLLRTLLVMRQDSYKRQFPLPSLYENRIHLSLLICELWCAYKFLCLSCASEIYLSSWKNRRKKIKFDSGHKYRKKGILFPLRNLRRWYYFSYFETFLQIPFFFSFSSSFFCVNLSPSYNSHDLKIFL